MRLRLAAYLSGILFLCVLVFPLFSSYHNPRASHIDMAQGQYQTSHDKKQKKQMQYLGFFSPPPRIAFRIIATSAPEYDNSGTAHSAGVIQSCRAPPLKKPTIHHTSQPQ